MSAKAQSSKKKTERDRTEHPLTGLTNRWRQSIRKVESLTGEYNQLCHQAGVLEAAIEEARKEQSLAWKEMAEYTVDTTRAKPEPTDEGKADAPPGDA